MKQKKIYKIITTLKKYHVHRKYKDRLFRKLFKEKKDLLELYNAINNTAYTNPDELEITTLEDTIILSMKNDLSFIISTSMNVYEHQSTFNPNMPIRGVFYFARLYQAYIMQQGLDIYGSQLIQLPTPQYVILYNGDADKPDRTVLKLSDAFQIPETESEIIPALECNAVMLNINYGHNEKLLNSCRRLKEYAIFVAKVKEYTKSGLSLQKAIDRAIDECIEADILKDILSKQRNEVKSMLLTEYDEKKRRKLDRKEGYEAGLESGIEKLVRLLKNHESMEEVKKDLMEQYELTSEEAEEKIQLYWK